MNGSKTGTSAGDSIRAGRTNGPFAMTPEWVILSGIPAPAQALYTVLVAHVSRSREDNYVWPGMDVLASILGYRRRQTLKPYLSELARIGALDITEVRDAQGYRHNVYTVHEIAPDGYAGMRSLEELYDQRRPEKVPMYARAHQAKSAVPPQAMCGTAHMNKTDATRQSDLHESTSGDTSGAAPRTSSQRATKAAKPDGQIVLTPPAAFYRKGAMKDGRAQQWMVSAAVAALENAGRQVATGARDTIGAQIKAAYDTNRREELVHGLEERLTMAVQGEPTLAWLFDPSNVRPPRLKWRDIIGDLDAADDPEEALIEHLHETEPDFGIDATVYSMSERYHPNAIVNTVRARAQ